MKKGIVVILVFIFVFAFIRIATSTYENRKRRDTTQAMAVPAYKSGASIIDLTVYHKICS